MKEVQDNKTIYWLLMQVMFQAKHRMTQLAEANGLTVMQFHALTTLKEDEAVAMNVLSSYFHCDASNVTGIVDRLEANGLVERRDNPKDRRVKMIATTAKGLKLRQELIDASVEAEAARLKPILTDEERETLHSLLTKMLVAQTEPTVKI